MGNLDFLIHKETHEREDYFFFLILSQLGLLGSEGEKKPGKDKAEGKQHDVYFWMNIFIQEFMLVKRALKFTHQETTQKKSQGIIIRFLPKPCSSKCSPRTTSRSTDWGSISMEDLNPPRPAQPALQADKMPR